MNKEEKSILEEIKTDIKKILELLENPKREIKNEKNPNKNSNSDDATEKQISFLKKEFVEINEGLTKQEASAMIKEIIKRKEKERMDY